MALNYVCSLNYICNLNYVRNLNYVYNLQTQPPRHPHLNRRHLGQGWRNWGPCGRCMAGGAAGRVGMPPPTTSTTLQSIPTYRFSMLLPLHLHSSVVPLAGAPLLPLPPKKVEGGGGEGAQLHRAVMTTTIDKASFGQSGYGHELSAEKKGCNMA